MHMFKYRLIEELNGEEEDLEYQSLVQNIIKVIINIHTVNYMLA